MSLLPSWLSDLNFELSWLFGRTDSAWSPGKRNHSRLGDFADAERLADLQQRLELAAVTRRLDGQRFRRYVNHLAAKQVHRFDDLAAGSRVGADLDQRQLTRHRVVVVLLDDLDDVDELVELLGDLLERGALRGDHDGHPRHVLLLGGADSQRLDVEPAPREQRRHP